MRLSDAGLRQRPTKLLYPNHRPAPFLTEATTTRDRSNRLLDADPCARAPMLLVDARTVRYVDAKS